MTNFRNASGEGIGDFVRRVSGKLVKEFVEQVETRVKEEYGKALKDRSQWNDEDLKLSGDLDLYSMPSKEDKSGKSSKMTIAQAVESAANNPQVIKSDGKLIISYGNIQELMSDSPRILFYEFGTLDYMDDQASSALTAFGIGSFRNWESLGFIQSKMRGKLGEIGYGFMDAAGKGRFGIGLMVPSGRRVKRFPGIKPVRMFRNATAVMETKINGIIKESFLVATQSIGG